MLFFVSLFTNAHICTYFYFNGVSEWMQAANVSYELKFCLFVSCQLNFGHFSVVS